MVTRFIAKLQYDSFHIIPFNTPKYHRQLALPNLSFKVNNVLSQKYIKNLLLLPLKLSFWASYGSAQNIQDKYKTVFKQFQTGLIDCKLCPIGMLNSKKSFFN
jgi:hypothetical protein